MSFFGQQKFSAKNFCESNLCNTTGWSSNVFENISYKNIATWRNSKSDKIFLLKNHLSLKNLHFLTYINLTQNSKPLNYSKVSLLNSKLVKKVFINIYFLSEFRIQWKTSFWFGIDYWKFYLVEKFVNRIILGRQNCSSYTQISPIIFNPFMMEAVII